MSQSLVDEMKVAITSVGLNRRGNIPWQAVADFLNRRGIKPPKGKTWSKSSAGSYYESHVTFQEVTNYGEAAENASGPDSQTVEKQIPSDGSQIVTNELPEILEPEPASFQASTNIEDTTADEPSSQQLPQELPTPCSQESPNVLPKANSQEDPDKLPETAKAEPIDYQEDTSDESITTDEPVSQELPKKLPELSSQEDTNKFSLSAPQEIPSVLPAEPEPTIPSSQEVTNQQRLEDLLSMVDELKEVICWYNNSKLTPVVEGPTFKPKFSRHKTKSAGLKINQFIYDKAIEKMRTETQRVGETFNSLVEFLLWEYAGRPIEPDQGKTAEARTDQGGSADSIRKSLFEQFGSDRVVAKTEENVRGKQVPMTKEELLKSFQK